MKIDYFGKFVDDDDPNACSEVSKDYSRLIEFLINRLNILLADQFFFRIPDTNIKPVEALNEYFNYNVEGFENFDVDYKPVDLEFGNKKIPVYVITPEDEKHKMITIGEPAELHYMLKDNKTLSECVNNNTGVISFGMKSGNGLFFTKNYIGNGKYIREEYVPGKMISADIFNADYILKCNKDEYNNKNITNSASPFKYPFFYQYNYFSKNVEVTKISNHKFRIDVTDCDTRPVYNEVVDGDSLYSTYYNYMVEKGYFKDNREKFKTKRLNK